MRKFEIYHLNLFLHKNRIQLNNTLHDKYTITSALPYANGPIHIGHLAGAYIPADLFVRFLRLNHKDVVYVCGSDEHGAAITIKAKKEGTTPEAIIDKYHQGIKKVFEEFGIAFDIYHRTSEKIHHDLSQEFFLSLYNKGEFIENTSKQYYDEEYHQFLADRYITGTCPNCGAEGAYGDQCEKCGSSLSPTELVNPRSILSGKTPVLKETTHWYLPLDKYQPWLEEWLLKDKKEHLKTNVFGQCQSWLKSGLQPRSMTRDLDWGVDVPLKEAKGKKLYVWLDAPIGYISATKQWALDTGKNWEDYWKKQENKEDESHLIHFIGKDNIVFHCIIFPTILHAQGEYILPDNIPANEFLNLEGDKLSTSKNHAVWLHEYLDEFPNKQDELRYVLTSILPETSDSEFTWKDYQAKVNNELVAILGNFVNRVMVLSHKYFDGVVEKGSDLTGEDRHALTTATTLVQKISQAILNYKFREALAQFMNLARLGNKYLADEEPWKKIKEDEGRVKTVLYVSAQLMANLALTSQVFLPKTAEKMFDMLGDIPRDWEDAGKDSLLPNGHIVNTPILLFEKVTDEQVDRQLEKLAKAKEKSQESSLPEQKPNISFDLFQKMDIRLGTILNAEKIAKTKKLIKLTVDTGIDQRTIVSGIAEFFKPEELPGKKVCVLLNLEPRKIRGVESQGMILMAEDTQGKLQFVIPENPLENGSVVR